MRLRDAISYAIVELASHKLRAGLTMLGMMFGVGAVIAMVAIGAGAEKQSLALIDKLGVRNVVVRAKQFKDEDLKEIRKKTPGLAARDVSALMEAVSDVKMVVPRIVVEPYRVASAESKAKASVQGIGVDYQELANLMLAEGRFLTAEDELLHRQVCLLGGELRRRLFGVEKALGQDVKINDVWCEVVGVLELEGSSKKEFGGVAIETTDSKIYLPFSTALRKFDHDALASPYDEIVIRGKEGVSTVEIGDQVSALLDKMHVGAKDYEVIVPQALLAQSRKTRQLFNLVMGAIAGISLLVGGIGVMNIMLASVLEQTREIGVRRAVGACRRDIRFQFLVSAFTLTLIGGVLGVAVGFAIAQLVAAYAGWPIAITGWSIAVSAGVSMAVGLVSGWYPAVRAAALDPIYALRYE